MTTKQLINNLLKPNNLYYILQAYYAVFIRRQYNKLYSDDDIDQMLYKTAKCPDCYFNGSCLECGCNFNELIKSDKPCPRGNF